MKDLFYYIGNETLYIRAEKLFERKFTGSSKPEVFRLCSNMRGFSLLGVTKRYSATYSLDIAETNKGGVVSSKRLTLSNNDTAYVNVLFGQAQQAVHTTKAAHAFHINPISKLKPRNSKSHLEGISKLRLGFLY